MKKSLLTFLVSLSIVCIGIHVVKAETSPTIVKSSKGLALDTQTKLARINSIVKNAQAMRGQMCGDCLDKLEYLEGVANAATDACGGPSGSNYNTPGCQSALNLANQAGDNFMASGCGWMLSYFKKTIENSVPNNKNTTNNRREFITLIQIIS